MDNEGHIDFRSLAKVRIIFANANPYSDQAIAVQTSKGNHYGFAYKVLHGDEASEDVFLNMLRERDDCALDLLVCLWTETREVDQPCMRMKKKLMALHLANGDMLLLLKGEPGLICRDLKRLF